MKSIMILGVARAGKTTLSRMIKDVIKDADLLHGDSIKNGIIRNSEQHFGLDEDDDCADFIQHSVAKSFQYQVKDSRGINVQLFEGSQIEPKVLKEYFDIENTIIVYLGHGDRDYNDIYSLCKDHDTDKDWSYHITDEDLMHNCIKWDKWNKHIKDECPKYGYMYVDTYEDRDSKLIGIRDRILSEINS